MNGQNIQILLCTNGSDQTRPSLEYGTRLASLLNLPVRLLGIEERLARTRPIYRRALKDSMDWASSQLEDAGVSFTRQVESGSAEDVICRVTREAAYLTVAGPFGRPAWRRWLRGHTYRTLLAGLSSPILYVPELRWPVQRVLICSGGLGYALSLAHFGFWLARACASSITLLHVVEPASFDYPLVHEVGENWERLLETDTPQGRNLKRLVSEAEREGIPLEFKLRKGNPVREITEEVREGKYDLVGLGSPHSTRSLRHYYLPNVTAEIAESIHVPTLSVRHGYELEQPL